MGNPVRRRSGRHGLLLLAGILPSVSFGLFPSPAHAASNVQIVVDGKTVSVPQTGETVRQALQDGQVQLGTDDQVSPDLDAAISDGGTVRVTRVSFTEGSVESKIPYRTVVRPASRDYRPYHPTVLKEGHVGLKRVTYRTKIVDGKETERSTVSEEVVRKPVDQVVVSRQPASLGSRGAYIGAKTFTVLATAYDPGPGSCGKYANGQTCNGKRAGYGVIAVDPKLIPLGAKLFVPGYGYGIAADVGGAIKGNHVDLGFNSRPGACAWGKKWVTLRIVD